MADFFDALNDSHIDFIKEQPMFFTATACAKGRINLSPKGLDTFRILSPNVCGYLDFVGSGNETSAHIKNDGRMTVMFNSFGRMALILRLYGKGEVVRPHNPKYAELAEHFPTMDGARQIILIHIETVQTSCGYGVPLMELKGERPTLTKWAQSKGEEGLEAYQREKNSVSIDGFDSGLDD